MRFGDVALRTTAQKRAPTRNSKVMLDNNSFADLRDWPENWLRIAEPEEVEKLSSLSWDTIKRRYSEYIVHLSERRVGMRVGHALMFGR